MVMYTERRVYLFLQLRGVDVASGLLPYLQAEIDRRGWDWTRLAAEAKISKQRLSKVVNHPDSIPTLPTLYALSRALKVSILVLIELIGFDVAEADRIPPQDRATILVQSVPELREVVDSLAQFSPEELQGILGYIAGRRAVQDHH